MDLEEAFKELDKRNKKTSEAVCKACGKGSIELDIPSSSALCKQCGTLDNDYLAIDRSPEWKEGDPSIVNRGNIPINKHMPKLSLVVNLRGRVPYRLKQYQIWSNYNNTYKECSLKKTLDLLNVCCQKIPEANKAVQEYAGSLLAKVIEDKATVEKLSLRGPNNKVGLIALCLVYAFRKRGIVHLREGKIAEMLGVNHKYLKCAQSLVLNIIQKEDIDASEVINPTSISSYAMGFLKRIGFSSMGASFQDQDEYCQKVMKLAKLIEKYKYRINSTPRSIASGCLYYVSQRNTIYTDILSQEKLAKRLGLSCVTINKCYNCLIAMEKEGLLLQEEI